MSLAQDSNASAASLETGRSRSPCLIALTGRVLAHSTDHVHDRIVLGFTRKFWFSIQGKPILYFKGLSFGYFSANRYATVSLVSSFSDKNRSWFFAQRY